VCSWGDSFEFRRSKELQEPFNLHRHVDSSKFRSYFGRISLNILFILSTSAITFCYLCYPLCLILTVWLVMVQPHLVAWYETIRYKGEVSLFFCLCIYSYNNLYIGITHQYPLCGCWQTKDVVNKFLSLHCPLMRVRPTLIPPVTHPLVILTNNRALAINKSYLCITSSCINYVGCPTRIKHLYAHNINSWEHMLPCHRKGRSGDNTMVGTRLCGWRGRDDVMAGTWRHY
jgi:hypothetical protein